MRERPQRGPRPGQGRDTIGRPGRTGAAVSVIDADGTGERQITTGASSSDPAEWSRDGTLLALVSRGNLFVADLDGGEVLQLAFEGGRDPDWSPDGTRIAYGALVEGADQIFLIDPDGTDRLRLTRRGRLEGGRDPEWSPDGSLIILTTGRYGRYDIFRVAADGSGEFRLTTFEGWGPVWSPDGSRVAYTAMSARSPFVVNIYVMDPLGRRNWRLTTHGGHHPVWSPAAT